MIPWLESFFRGLLGAIDISSGINFQVIGVFFALAILGEVYIQVPLLMESILLAVGYQAASGGIAGLNAALVIIAASTGRQVTMNTVYYLVGKTSSRVSKFFTGRMQKNKYYLRYIQNEKAYNERFLSTGPAFMGMMTWLNGPIKFVLIVQRRRRVLVLATLFSGLLFDAIYMVMGAVYHETPLPLTYMPLLFLVGFVIFFLLRLRTAK